MSLDKNFQTTPRGERLHIGLFGKRNAGKSSLVNALTGQSISVVSEIAGTTTDPVYKSMELIGLGAVVFIDTAGFDEDDSILGKLRLEKTYEAVEKTDVAMLLINEMTDEEIFSWINRFKQKDVPTLLIMNKNDELTDDERNNLKKRFKKIIFVSATTKQGLDVLRDELLRSIPNDFGNVDLLGGLVEKNDLVLLVMPQDLQAPKGRLILPQVQIIRALLDKQASVMSTTFNNFAQTIKFLSQAPKLIITDSQIFDKVFQAKPAESLLTSFSVLFANYKGDINYFVESAKKIDNLPKDGSAKILIAEACTHHPIKNDIGRDQLPKKFRHLLGEKTQIDFVRGVDFPKSLEALAKYDLIVHCGACMFNRQFLLSRVAMAQAKKIPMTNYGVLFAKFSGILEKITLPK